MKIDHCHLSIQFNCDYQLCLIMIDFDQFSLILINFNQVSEVQKMMYGGKKEYGC